LTAGVILVGVGYYAGALLGLRLAFRPDYISAVWFPNSVLLASLLLTKPRRWPLWLLAAVPAELAADIPAGISAYMALKFVAVDMLEVVSAAVLVRRFVGRSLAFDGMRSTVLYFACASIAAPFAAAFMGSYITGGDPLAPPYWKRFYRWFLSDSLTHLVVTPTILIWCVRDFRLRIPPSIARALETVCLLTGLAASSLFTFGGVGMDAAQHPWMLTLPLPFLLWAAARYGTRCVLTLSLFLTFVAIYNSSIGIGPFTQLNPAANVLNLQLFLIMPLASLITAASALEERARSDELVRVSLREKDTLLREIHHRVKNNLQVISGLLDLQAHHLPEVAAVKEVYQESRNRVLTMALIHEELYQTLDLAKVGFADYIAKLVTNLATSMGIDRERIELQVRAEKAALVVDTAIPVSLIVNELVTNAFKHAFPGNREGSVVVGFRTVGDRAYEVWVSDDGVGLPHDLDPGKQSTLGMKLIMILTEQLGGILDLDRTHGTTFRIRFKEYIEAGTEMY